MAVPIRSITRRTSQSSLEQDMSLTSVSLGSTRGPLDVVKEGVAYYTLPPEPDAHGSVEYKLFLDPNPKREQRLVTQLLWRLGQTAPQTLQSEQLGTRQAQIATYMLGVLDNGACLGTSPRRMSTSLECLDRMVHSLYSPTSRAPVVDEMANKVNRAGSTAGIGLRIVRAMAIRRNHIPRWVEQQKGHADSNVDEDSIQTLQADSVRALLQLPLLTLTTSLALDLQSEPWPHLVRAEGERSLTRVMGPDLHTMRAVVQAQQRAHFPNGGGADVESSLPIGLDPSLAMNTLATKTEAEGDGESAPKLNKKRQAARARRLRRKIDMIRREREGMGIFDHSEIDAALGTSTRDSPHRIDDNPCLFDLQGESAFNLAVSVDIEEGFSFPDCAPQVYTEPVIKTPPTLVSTSPASEEDDDSGFAFPLDLDELAPASACGQLRGQAATPRPLSPGVPQKSDMDHPSLTTAPCQADTWIPTEDNCNIILEVQVVRWLT